MRLWHQNLIPYLPTQWLLGQHRECCAMRGKMWGRKHSTVDYVWEHPFEWLVAYHWIVIDKLIKHDVNPNVSWDDPCYRGQQMPKETTVDRSEIIDKYNDAGYYNEIIYPEHDDNYLQECLSNLRLKGINI